MTKISHKHGKGYCVEDKGQFFYFKTIQEAMAKGLELDDKKEKELTYIKYICYTLYIEDLDSPLPHTHEQNKRQNSSRVI